MTTLRNLLIESAELENRLVELAGELTPELEQSLMVIETKIPAKIDRYMGLIDRLETEAENLNNKGQKYISAAKSLANLKQKLLDNVKHVMKEGEIQSLKGTDEAFVITQGKKSVSITSILELPREFIVQTISQRPDKEKIYDALSKGETVPGCHLEETKVLRRKIVK